jgi:sugar/nucleoside kinase (ribokinase family)
MIGTGGVGSGMFFALNGNHTLGREESRSGRIIDRKDYCKLHIVFHYAKTLLGPSFELIPIAKVGNDDIGRDLIAEIEAIGLNTSYMETCENKRTLFSFCFIYPDGSGGNLTTDDSASSTITPADVIKAEETFRSYGKRAVGLAVPEVPIDARITLLELSTEYHLYRVASFTSHEMEAVKNKGILKKIDLLAINVDEASSFTGSSKTDDPQKIVNTAIVSIAKINPELEVSITSGSAGSWTWDTETLNYQSVPDVEVVSTAGAGDAFLAGMIIGITSGLPLFEAQKLATLVAALSVTSPHTIYKEIDKIALRQLVDSTNYPVCDSIIKMLDAVTQG